MVSEAGASVYSASDARARGVSRAGRDRARRDLHRAPAAGSAGRAGEDRSQEHRRRPVPARRLADGPARRASTTVVDSCVNQVGRQREHRVVPPAGARVGHRPGAGARDRRAPRQDGPVQVARRPAGGAALLEEGVRAGGRASCACPTRPTRSTTPASTPSATPRSTSWRRSWASTTAALLGAGVKLVKQARGLQGGGRRVHLRRHGARAGEAGPRSARRRSCRSRSAPTSTS